MRRYILFVSVILSTSVALMGQTVSLGPSMVHNLLDTIPRQIKISKSLTKKARKEALATSSNNMTISSYAGGILQSFLPTNKIPDERSVVGEISLYHQVTSSGATVYTVPVECLPGRNGTQPNISLTYNSMGGNNVLGYGWSIDGLSVISRTSSSIYYDNAVKPMGFLPDNPFMLDGTRLIKITGSSVKYIFEPEQGNMRVEAFLSNNVVKYFKVWYPNGSTAIFGYENNTNHQLTYPLTKFTDHWGNFITYNYALVGNRYLISDITYGGSISDASTFASISFTYKSRNDVSEIYAAGRKIGNNRLLDKIVCTDYTGTRTYTFSYLTEPVSLLSQIHCQLPSGYLSPLTFYYGTLLGDFNFRQSESSLTEFFNNTTVSDLVINKGKFDMWSDDDALIVYPNMNPYFEVNQLNQKYYQNMFHPDQDLLVYQSLAETWVFPSKIKAEEGFMELTSGNIDGIPGDEVIKINNRVTNTRDQVIIQVYKPYISGSYISVKTGSFDFDAALENRGRRSITPKTYCMGDFLGNGKMQIFAVSRDNPIGTGKVSRGLFYDGDGFISITSLAGLSFKATGSASDILFGLDYDGDGKADICHIHANGTDIYSFSAEMGLKLFRIASLPELKRDMGNRKLSVDDINGDGKTDFLLSPMVNDYTWTFYFSKGAEGFEAKTKTLYQINHRKDSKYVLHDVDGDGLPELIQQSGSTFQVSLLEGRGHIPSSGWTGADAYLVPNVIAKGNYHSRLLSLYNHSVKSFYNAQDKIRDRMISGAANSMGVVTQTEYKRLNENNGIWYGYIPFYTKGTGAQFPYENFDGPVHVTVAGQVWKNDIKYEDLNYAYHNASIHKQGRGFCGFERFSVTDNMRGHTTTQTFDPMRYGVPVKEETSVSRTESKYDISADANKRATIRLTEQKGINLLNK